MGAKSTGSGPNEGVSVGRLPSVSPALRRRGLPARIPPRRIATTILVLTVIGYGGIAVPGVVLYTTGIDRVVSLVFLVATVVLQLAYFSRVDRVPQGPTKYLALLLHAALVVVPIVLYGPLWRELPGMLAGNALLVLNPVVGVSVFVLVVVGLVVLDLSTVLFTAPDTPLALGVYFLTSAVTAGIAIYGLSTLVRLVVQAEDAREEMRRTAVEHERLRIAGDLHDLLSQSLSAIALRGQLVARLMTDHADRARVELTEVLELARKALVDVRTVVTVRRELDGGDSGGAVAPADTVAGRQAPLTLLQPRLGMVLLGIVLLNFGITTVIAVGQDRGAAAAVAVGLVRLVQAGLVLHLTQSRHRQGRLQRALELLALAALAWGPVPFLGAYSGRGEGLLIGAALVVLPPLAGAAVFAVGWVAAVAQEFVNVVDPALVTERAANAAVGTIVLTLIVYGLATVARLVAELRLARAGVSAVAVARERVRFSQDVHDLLGFSLSAVALKTELVGKLVTVAPDRARAELGDLLETAHRALADVRTVAGGNRDLSLEDECRLVHATLSAANVDVTLVRTGAVPDGPVGSVLATVLREAATNVLRHSKAERCEIVVGRVAGRAVLKVTNDGVGPGRITDGPGGGNGLRNMAERVEAMHGELSTSADEVEHRLVVRIPLTRSGAGRRVPRRRGHGADHG